jgi:RNA polymerase sigma-70 factor (ECF subfamily)
MVRENLCVQAVPGEICGISSGSRDEVVMNDPQWIQSAREGDEDAYAELVRRYSGGLHRAVARILADDTEAWDVVQMAFLKAWQKLDRYDPRYSFTTWLYRIGTNLAIDLLRSRTSRERAHKAGTEHRLRVVGSGEGAGARVDSGEADDILRQLVRVLTPQQRSAFVLREMEGLETAEVADVLGCSATTVRNHIFQARKALRRELRERFPEYLPASERG